MRISKWQRALRVVFSLTLALAWVPGGAPTAYAAAGFTGGVDLAPPAYMLNDHTAYAVHFSADASGGLAPNTVYSVMVRLSSTPSSGGGGTARGYTWNPGLARWVQEREGSSLMPTVTTDASGAIGSNAGWTYFKVGDETFTGHGVAPLGAGQSYLVVSLNAGGLGTTLNGSNPCIVNIVDAKTQGAWVHNGAATGAAAAKRAEALKSNDASISYSLSKTEVDLLDDDSNGIIDDEDYGPAGKTGDFRFGVPAGSVMNVKLNQAAWAAGQGVAAGLADTDVAIGAAETLPPTAPSSLTGTKGSNSVSLSWAASSDSGGSGLAGYKVYRMSGTQTNATPVPSLVGTTAAGVTSFVDGSVTGATTYTYYVRAFDGATNVSARSNQIDVIPFNPITTTFTVPPQAVYNNSASFSLVATQPLGPGVARTFYRVDGAAVTTYTAPIGVSTFGAHTLAYWSVDTSGAVEPTRSIGFTIADTIKPTTVSDVNAAYLDTAVIHLIAADSVGGSGVAHTYYKIDGGATREGTLVTVSTFGAHTIQFWSVDTAGNTESVVAGSFYIDDATAPVTTSNAVATYYDSTAHITLTATDTGGVGVDATYYNLDGTGWDVGTSVDANTLGSHTLSFYSVDLEANQETTKTVSFTVLAGPEPGTGDTVAPVSSDNAAATYPTSPVSIRLTSTDNVGGTGMAAIYYRVDGGAIVTITPSAIHAAAGTPGLGIPADHSPAAPTSCACHATLIPATHSAGASPASCACHAITKPTVPVDVPYSHADRTAGNCKGCHPAAGVIMPVSSSNPNHYGQSAGYIGGGECKACHTYHVADPPPPPVPPASMSTTVVVSGVGAHTIEYWGADVAGNVETPHKTASFTILPVVVNYTITASAGTNGVIAPTGAQTYAAGTNAAFTITPASGYHIADVLVDGVSVGAVGSYTFSSVGADHTISASFAPNVQATSITIRTSGTSAYVGNVRTLSGAVTPPGMIGMNIVAMVKKPGRTFYSYSSNRTVYDLAGAGAWLYKYKFIAGMTKGLYVFRADVPASSGFLASSSGTVTIRLR